MKDKILQFCREQQLLSPGDTVICAVSGGADSMAMLLLLHSLRQELDITVAAAHFNHCLRGTESDGDEAFVRAFCETRQIPFHLGSGDAAAYARQHGLSLEEAARTLRYRFFDTLHGTVATAHTA
ncbi:MAG: tRNA(Ile)-lysidine synthetase, partial [Oscillospiraceae bacterium]|nr:tRNA(Ile)-lysidine synthetase [Oscillospiraceae bacterium]